MKRLTITFWICLSFLLVGCGSKNNSDSNYTILSSQDLLNFLLVTNKMEVLGSFIVIPDEKYYVPSIDWVNNTYTPKFREFLTQNGVITASSSYEKEDNDCDDFTSYGMTVAHLLYLNSTNRPKNAAICIGEAYYYQSVQDHAVNFWIVLNKERKLKIMFYEPQLQDFVNLNPRETTFKYIKL